MLRLGYCLPFLSAPPLPLFPSQCLLPAPSPSRGLLWRRSPWASLPWVLWSLLHSLLRPSVHSVEDLGVMASGHRPLPSHSLVDVSPFQMVTIQSVLLSVRQGDWMASIDLAEAYLQMPVHPTSRHFLRFIFRDTVYQFQALCFGLATAPQVFTRVMAPVSAILHSLGIHMRRYLDDWLVQSSSRGSLLEGLQTVLQLCHELGIVVTPRGPTSSHRRWFNIWGLS